VIMDIIPVEYALPFLQSSVIDCAGSYANEARDFFRSSRESWTSTVKQARRGQRKRVFRGVGLT